MNRKAERNAAIVAAYRAGELQADIAARFGINRGRVSVILRKEGARLDRDALEQRLNKVRASNAKRPDVRAKIAATVRQKWAEGRMNGCGRPRLFANDPDKRADYLRLRDAFGSEYAREAMGL
jgi:hypothetical protein